METSVVEVAVVGFLFIGHHVHPETIAWKQGVKGKKLVCIFRKIIIIIIISEERKFGIYEREFVIKIISETR